MSVVIATPELMAAATDLAAIGETISAAHLAAAAPTVAVLPAAADEVSAGIAHLFSVQAQDYQVLAGKAAAFHEQFVQNVTASAVSYASAEAANVALLLQPLTAIADSIGSAIVAAQNVLIDCFNYLANFVFSALYTIFLYFVGFPVVILLLIIWSLFLYLVSFL